MSANVRNLALTQKVWLGETLLSFQKIYHDHVRIEYGEMINASKISNSDNAIDDAWHVYNHKKVPD